MTIPIIQNSKGNHSMEVRLDRGPGANNSFSGRVVEEREVVVGSSFKLVEAGFSFLVGLAFERDNGVFYALAGLPSNTNGIAELGSLSVWEDHSHFWTCSIEILLHFGSLYRLMFCHDDNVSFVKVVHFPSVVSYFHRPNPLTPSFLHRSIRCNARDRCADNTKKQPQKKFHLVNSTPAGFEPALTNETDGGL